MSSTTGGSGMIIIATIPTTAAARTASLRRRPGATVRPSPALPFASSSVSSRGWLGIRLVLSRQRDVERSCGSRRSVAGDRTVPGERSRGGGPRPGTGAAGTSLPIGRGKRARASGTSSTTGTPLARAISLIRSAIRRWPLATILGARIVSESYLSATARWVGFVTTTSAVGTASIIRAKAIWRARRRRWAWMCGSPSDSRASRLTSSLVILSAPLARRRWTTKSARATTASRMVIVRPSWKMASIASPAITLALAPPRAISAGTRPPTTCQVTTASRSELRGRDQQPDERLAIDDAADPGRRVQPLGVEPHGPRREDEAAADEVAGDARHGDEQPERQDQPDGLPDSPAQAIDHERRDEARLADLEDGRAHGRADRRARAGQQARQRERRRCRA